MKLRRHHSPSDAMRRAGNCPTCLATGRAPLGTPLHFQVIDCPACDGTGRR